MLSIPDFKTWYDRYLLVALGLIAALAAILAATAAKEGDQGGSEAQVERHPYVGSKDVETLRSDLPAVAVTNNWRESDASPFVSRVYLLKDQRLVDILEAGNDLFPGIPNAWILENNLDYLDPDLPDQDADGDGFSNKEEYMAKTNPRDATSKPEDWSKLRLSDVQIQQMQLIFTGRDFKGRAMINSVAASSEDLTGKPIGPTKTYAPGDTLIVAKFRPGFSVTYEEEKTPFRLADFRVEKRENPRITVDGKPQVEEVVLAILESTGADKARVELESGKPQISPYSLATLVDTRPGGETFRVRSGDSFKMGDSGPYKLVDVSVEKATILDGASGDKHDIPKATQAPESQSSPAEAQIK